MEAGTLKPPERTTRQRADALRRANVIRIYRADLKKDVAAGRVVATKALDDPLCATMKVLDLLLKVPKIGISKAQAILRGVQVSQAKTIGGLSTRQREELRAILRKGGER